LRLVVKWAVTDDDLRRALLDNEPQIVHFAGHGTGQVLEGTGRDLASDDDVDSGGLAFENDDGKIQLITGDALARLFELCADSVKCVVLNACYSESQANAISQHIDFVVGMKKAIGDQAAIKFAVGFYDALGAGRDFEKAFKFGCSAIDLKGISEHLTPIFKKSRTSRVSRKPTKKGGSVASRTGRKIGESGISGTPLEKTFSSKTTGPTSVINDVSHKNEAFMGVSSELVNDLRQQIATGQVLAIVGAGVSIGATNNNAVASWGGLLRHGVERCVQVIPNLDANWPLRVRAEIESPDTDDVLSAAEKIETKLRAQGGEYSRWLRETVGALKAQARAVISALRELGVPIATTNYDSLIEEVTGLPAVTWRESVRVEHLIRGSEPGVLHLHGHWRDPASVVLGIRSYEKVLGDVHAQTIQQALRAARTLLFVGYGAGLTDPNFGALLRWSRHVFSGSEYRHFRLALKQDVKATQVMHPAEERIYVLPYGDNHDDLAPFLRSLLKSSGPPDDSERRKKYREKARRALADQLALFFEDNRRNPRDIATALEIKKIPNDSAKICDAIPDHLLDNDDSIPLLNGLISDWVKRKVRDAVEILENCMDLILPFHFAPDVVATVSNCLNEKGGGLLKGVVMTKCGAELMMAALDQLDSRFDPNDPELSGKHAIGRSFPPLGKISIDEDAEQFLSHILETESKESRLRRLKWDRMNNKRTTYCVVRLPQEPSELDYALKLLDRVSAIQPELPILLLTTDSQARNSEEEYLRVIRRRFETPRR
jgi:hypothetical protein